MLKEDVNNKGAGVFSGKLTSKFLIDEKGKPVYNTMSMHSDGYCNNQFVGSWTDNKTKISQKCNWVDYRIPHSGDLDIGAGGFWLNKKYRQNGWENYPDDLNEKWW